MCVCVQLLYIMHLQEHEFRRREIGAGEYISLVSCQLNNNVQVGMGNEAGPVNFDNLWALIGMDL